MIDFPNIPDKYSPALMRDLVASIRRAILPLISKDEAAPRVLLQSPNGTVYSLTVTDAGVLSVVKNDGKSRL